MIKSILVLSNKWDTHADSVIKEIQKHGGSVIRINTEDFRKNKILYKFNNDSIDWKVTTPEGRVISTETICGVYIRRISMPVNVSDIHTDFQDFTQKETLVSIESLWTLLRDVIWLNQPILREVASNKIYQLMVAQSVGLYIPQSIITNEVNQAQNFCRHKTDVIYKTLHCPIIQTGNKQQRMINTSIIPKNASLSEMHLMPSLLQEYIPKAYELRIHIIGTKIITIKIDSQNHPDGKIDWRVAQNYLHYEHVEISNAIKSKIFQLMSRLQLQFGIIDMIVTKGGDYVFLEVNPDGNWLWIEQKIQASISESIALYFLTNKGG